MNSLRASAVNLINRLATVSWVNETQVLRFRDIADVNSGKLIRYWMHTKNVPMTVANGIEGQQMMRNKEWYRTMRIKLGNEIDNSRIRKLAVALELHDTMGLVPSPDY